MIGPHVIHPTPPALRWAGRAGLVKQLDGTEALRAAPEGAVRVFRHFFSSQRLDAPEDAAAAILTALGGYRHPSLFVEVWNEAHPTAAQMQAVVTLLHAAGVKVAIGSWGTGDYTETDWDAARQSGGDAIAVHCYWADHGFTPWNALRYRQFWRPGDPPVIVTECGRDRVRDGANGEYVGQPGWRQCGLSLEEYASELEAYSQEIAKDRYVLGACVFTSGASPDWEAFDVDEISDGLEGGTMAPDDLARIEQKLDQLLQQNALLTEAWKRFRQGKFTGADGIDGLIVALQGGKSLDFTPTYPKASGR